MSQPIREEEFTLDDMVSELEEFYENAGFADYYEKVLKHMTEAQIRDSFHGTFFPDGENEEKMASWRAWYFEKEE